MRLLRQVCGFLKYQVSIRPAQVAWEMEFVTSSSFFSSSAINLGPFSAPIFSTSLCGSGGSFFGGSGTLSPDLLSFDFSETPPSVPRVPSFGPNRFGSSITPSFEMGVPGSTACSTSDSRKGVTASSWSSLSFVFLRSRSALVSTNGPWCGRPSLPSTGASLVPTGFAFPGTTAASTGALAGAASRLTKEEPDVGAFIDLAESVGSRKGKSSRKRGAGRRRSLMVQILAQVASKGG